MNRNSSTKIVVTIEKKIQPPPQTDPAPNCPRCDSENTKFCYYNNYSLSQPRYFCKSCKRYWTKGGALRNVPVGGGCRKNKRSTKRAFYTPYNQFLAQSHLENNAMIMSSSSNNSPLSNFSSPLSYESSSATGDSLSMAFARLQKQCDGDYHGHLGFEFWNQNQPLSTDLAFLSNGFERQIINCNSQSLYNLGFENVGDHQNYLGHSYSQPLVPNEDLSLINGAELSAAGGEAGFNLISGPMKLESLEVNRMILEVNNGGASADNHNNNSDNVVLGNDGRNGFFGLASPPAFWPNLFNSTA